MGKRTGKIVQCIECKTEHYRAKYQLREDSRYFCSRVCADKGHGKFLTKYEYGIVACPYCEKEFQQHWKGPKKYCSTSCSSRAQLRLINSSPPKYTGTKPELKFKEKLEEFEIEYTHQYWVSWKRGWKKWYDFYLPEYNMLVEVDGEYHHAKGVKTSDLDPTQWNTRKNDRFKNYLSKIRGFNLKRIWSLEVYSLSYDDMKDLING